MEFGFELQFWVEIQIQATFYEMKFKFKSQLKGLV